MATESALDATPSTSLIPKAANDPNYQRLITDAIEYAKQKLAHGTPEEVCTCAQAKVTLVSPFVGNSDPRVESIRHIYMYNKKHEHATKVMAASFRDTEQIKGLVGCDLLAISPALLAQLERDTEKLAPALNCEQPEGLKPVVPQPEERVNKRE